MDNIHTFPCPNCGGHALRRHFVSQEAIYSGCPKRQMMTTECPACDYLMTVCSLDGKVIETSSSQFTVAITKQSDFEPQVIPFHRRISA